jgi:transcriptional regulator with XRE-family HTH domain
MSMSRSATAYDAGVARRIRAARLAIGLTRAELASVLGISSQQVAKYETAVNRLSVGRLVAIARALKIPVEDLISSDGQCGLQPVSRVCATGQLVRDFGLLDTALQGAVLDLVRALAPDRVDSTDRKHQRATRK